MSEADEPKWLSLNEVKFINQKVVERSDEPYGLRDVGLLDSALARPKHLHAYGENDIHQLAASYAEGVSRNHPFIQGNKRTAFEAADMFLSGNGYELQQAKGLEHVEMMERLGQGKIDRSVAADHLREHSHAAEQQRQQGGPEQKLSVAERLEQQAQEYQERNGVAQQSREQGRER